jgi:hypothetical protein
MNTAMLPTNALAGVSIGLSASESADLGRLGLMDEHFRLALRELARIVLVSGGTLVYGGNLDAGSYTWVLVNELRRYAGDGLGLRLMLHWLEHRRRSLASLEELDDQLGIRGELLCVNEDGSGVLPQRGEGRGAEAGATVTDAALRVASVTGLRQVLTARCDARLLIGGRRAGYIGPMPGVLQEALLSLDAGQPLYLAGGLGGMALNLAAAVDPACGTLLPPYSTDAADVPLDAATQAGLARVRAWVGDGGWARLHNGLSDAQNRQLAATHRPAEIAALVSLGLGRWRAASAANSRS